MFTHIGDACRAPGLLPIAMPCSVERAVRSVESKPDFCHRLLGVDFGTCWSKLVLRDYEAPEPRCFVVRPGSAFDAGDNYRIPSNVTVDGKRLYFGWTGELWAQREGARVVRSPKLRAAYPTSGHWWLDLSAEDVAVLVVAYLLHVGFENAKEYCAGLSPPATPRMTMTMGAPMAMLEPPLDDRFLSIARIAYDVWKAAEGGPWLAKGIDVSDARNLLASARRRIAGRTVHATREWVRSEAEAGMLWVFRSPKMAEGAYGCVDVGAGTTDVSFFRIRAELVGDVWVKSAFGFYSARSAPPAMDALGECLADITAHGRSLSRLRGEEDAVIKELNLRGHEGVRTVCGGVFETYRRTWGDAFLKWKKLADWHGYGLFVVGGGSKVEAVVDTLRKSVWRGQLDDRELREAGRPEDLEDWPEDGRRTAFREEPTFLLVAYGLSWLGVDVPVADKPSDMRPMEFRERVRPPIDQDEYYPK